MCDVGENTSDTRTVDMLEGIVDRMMSKFETGTREYAFTNLDFWL
jgi:hypothetical protein